MSFPRNLPPLQLRVLIYQDESEWVAHMLEMDLLGTGDTPEKAEAALRGAFDAQMSFCLQEDVNPFHPAPQRFFGMWEEAQAEAMRSLVQAARPRDSGDFFLGGSLSVSTRDRGRYARRKGFELANS